MKFEITLSYFIHFLTKQKETEMRVDYERLFKASDGVASNYHGEIEQEKENE